MPFIADLNWTPSSYRAALAAWRVNAPANDSDIMPTPRKGKSRHVALTTRLRPLLVYRDPPAGEVLQSNWRTRPDNDNRPPNDFSSERGQEISPTDDEMMAAVAKIDFHDRKEARLHDGKFHHVPAGRIDHPTGEGVEWGVDRDGKPVVVRLGRLRFSNGKHTERAVRRAVGGGVEDYAARIPTGGLRYSSQKQTRVLGPKHASFTKAANLRVADWFGYHELYEPVPGKRKKTRGKLVSKATERQWLAEAIANTPMLPEVKKLPDGLPIGTKDLGALFLSFGKSATKSGGQASWEDFATRLSYAAAWQQVRDELPDETVAVLDAAMEATSMIDIGRAVGASESYAERAGKRALEAANDNLAAAMQIMAA